MSLLTISRALARNAGMTVPDVVISSPDRQWGEAVEMCNTVCEDLARRVDWGQLTKTTTLTGTGASAALSLPNDFSRLVAQNGVSGPARPLTRAEWGSLTPTEGTPRYFLLEDGQISLFPHLAPAATATVTYQSENWCSNGTAAWTADTDTSLIDEAIVEKGLIAMWRRQKGMDYADYEAEFEAALAQVASYNDGSRL